MAQKEETAVKSKLDMAEAGEDEVDERGNWTGKLDFLLSCIGYAVGLGNVWRFPYLCYKHGGGAFLLPYSLMLLFIGIPCFFLEISIGQFAALGPVTLYSNMAPLFKGLGFANFMASSFVGLYYNMIIAWTIYYLYASLTTQLPWSTCDNDFNSEFCFSITDFKNCSEYRDESPSDTIIYHRGRCLTTQEDLDSVRSNLTFFYNCTREIKHFVDPDNICGPVNYTEKAVGVYVGDECVETDRVGEIEELQDIPPSIRRTAAQEYLRKSVLKESKGLHEIGGIQPHLAFCLFLAWVVIFFCLIKGIKSSGKVVYFTATFPYLMLVILFFRAITLPGAMEGIRFYIVPDFSRLTDVTVWEGAAVQIFFSLSVAGGGLVTLASYNKFDNNVVRDTVIVCFGNCLTSVFAGFAIFSVLGFLATELGVEVEDVVQSGTGLAFIAYPDLVTRLPLSPLWSILFFAMLFTLGLDSQFAIVETVLSGILDFKPDLRPKKTIVVLLVCIVGFIGGLPLTTEGGGYILDLLDYYAAGWPYLFIGLTELVIISHVYGLEQWLADVRQMVGSSFTPGPVAKAHLFVLYMTLSPLIIFVILMYSWLSYTPLTKGDYTYPPWANAIGWLIAMTAIMAVPCVALAQVLAKATSEYKDLGLAQGMLKAVRHLSRPTKQWRANANRAMRRQHRIDDFNGIGDNEAKGVDNLAMEGEGSSKL